MKVNGLEASKQPTQHCHLSSFLPAATQRLSLCKTDICPEAFFMFLFFLLYFACNLCSGIYHRLTPGVLLQSLKTSASARNQAKISTMKDDLKFSENLCLV